MTSLMLIENDGATRRSFQNWLMRQGYAVTSASDGTAGLAAVRKGQAQLLLCDIDLPGVDGLMLIHTARLEYPTLPIIAFSSGLPHPCCSFLFLALNAGANRILFKPFNECELLQLVGDLLAPPARKRPAFWPAAAAAAPDLALSGSSTSPIACAAH